VPYSALHFMMYLQVLCLDFQVFAIRDLTLLFGCQIGHPACKKIRSEPREGQLANYH